MWASHNRSCGYSIKMLKINWPNLASSHKHCTQNCLYETAQTCGMKVWSTTLSCYLQNLKKEGISIAIFSAHFFYDTLSLEYKQKEFFIFLALSKDLTLFWERPVFIGSWVLISRDLSLGKGGLDLGREILGLGLGLGPWGQDYNTDDDYLPSPGRSRVYQS